MDKISQNISADSKSKTTGNATTDLDTMDLEENCLNAMEIVENQLPDDHDIEHELEDMNLDVPELGDELDLSQQQEIDGSQEFEMSLERINKYFSLPMSTSNSKRDIHPPRDVFEQSELKNNTNENVLSTQMEVKAIQDFFVDYQTEDPNEDLEILRPAKDKQSKGRLRRVPMSLTKYPKISINEAIPNVLNFTTVSIAGN